MSSNVSETVSNVSKKIYEIAKGWDIKEFQVQVNENDLFVSLKASKQSVDPQPIKL